MTLVIPSWMEESAPGAAEAARSIAAGTPSDAQWQRLTRLTSDGTKGAWLEPRRERRTDKKKLSEEEFWKGHHELMWEAYRAPDFRPIGQPEIDTAKATLIQVGNATKKLSMEIDRLASDLVIESMWMTFRSRRKDNPAIASLPLSLRSTGTALSELSNFFQSAAQHPSYKPEGPVPPIGKPKDDDAIKTTVIRQLVRICLNHFGTPLHGTVAILANASLDRSDIKRGTVQRSLPRL